MMGQREVSSKRGPGHKEVVVDEVAQLNPEYARLLKMRESMTPEQEELVRQKHAALMKDFFGWAEKVLRPRYIGAISFGGWVPVGEDPRKVGSFRLHSKEGGERGLRVILDGTTREDGRRWIHLSVSRISSVPTWEDLKAVKERFLHGWAALQVFPPKEEWVNVHDYTLHLWVCHTERLTPDFRVGFGDGIYDL